MSQICTRGAKMKKSEWPGEWCCGKCGIVRVDRSDEYEYDNLYNDRPDVCQTCGGDYPNCTDGCPLVN